MITKDYNPSPIEVKFVEVLCELKAQINDKLDSYEVKGIKDNTSLDNPTIDFFLTDQDGDDHVVVLKVIQRPDTLS